MSSWFLHDPVFLLLLPVLAIPWFDFNKNAKPFPFPGCYLLQDAPNKITRMGWLSRTSFGACLLFLILGLAQPSKIIKDSSVKIEGLAVEFVLDISGSMSENLILEQGQPISRLNLAKENIHYFLQGKSPNFSTNSFKQNYEGRAGDFIGLVAFASLRFFIGARQIRT
jgi:hypothetical protein